MPAIPVSVPVNHLFCDRNHKKRPESVCSLGMAENAHEVASSSASRCVDSTAPRGVTRDDYGRNHFECRPVSRGLCESEVAMATGYHRVCDVASPDGGGAVEMVSGC